MLAIRRLYFRFFFLSPRQTTSKMGRGAAATTAAAATIVPGPTSFPGLKAEFEAQSEWCGGRV